MYARAQEAAAATNGLAQEGGSGLYTVGQPASEAKRSVKPSGAGVGRGARGGCRPSTRVPSVLEPEAEGPRERPADPSASVPVGSIVVGLRRGSSRRSNRPRWLPREVLSSAAKGGTSGSPMRITEALDPTELTDKARRRRACPGRRTGRTSVEDPSEDRLARRLLNDAKGDDSVGCELEARARDQPAHLDLP